MKKILLTGSSSGFGLLTIKTLASKGHTIYATMRNVNGKNAGVAKEIRDWAKENKAKVEVVELDVTSDASVNTAIKTILTQAGGHIDALINNAGLAFIGSADSLTNEQTDQLFQVNTIGADRVIKAILPSMRTQKDGLIINVTSVVVRNQMPLMTTYNATKAALDALSVGYHYELRSQGVDVVIVQPGGYPTTDIVSNSLKAGNPDAESNFGPDMVKMKAALIHYFTPTPTSPNPQEVADKFLELIEQPKGNRPLWSLVGAGPLESYINQVNQGTKGIVDAAVSSMTA